MLVSEEYDQNTPEFYYYKAHIDTDLKCLVFHFGEKGTFILHRNDEVNHDIFYSSPNTGQFLFEQKDGKYFCKKTGENLLDFLRNEFRDLLKVNFAFIEEQTNKINNLRKKMFIQYFGDADHKIKKTTRLLMNTSASAAGKGGPAGAKKKK
jgi:frataxin-like iron-binding protein CyaY